MTHEGSIEDQFIEREREREFKHPISYLEHFC